MTLVIPVKLKMSINPFIQVRTCSQSSDNDEKALDKVIDAQTEFNVSSEEENKSPNKSYNLKNLEQKRSSTSLYTKLDYFVDHNELPKVHRTPSNQSLVSEKILPRNNIAQNYLSNSIENFAVKSDLSQISTPISPKDNGNSKTVLEKYETGSNNSYNSTLTDIQSSFISSISDIDDPKNNIELENAIRELKNKLQEKEIENNQLTFALKDIEWKTELKCQEKYQEILRYNANLEGQFKTVQNQLENLLKEKQHSLNNKEEKTNIFEEYTKIQSKLNNFEKSNSELTSKLILATNESKQWQKQNLNLESENENLRINIQELKIELDSKNSVLQSLKNKITEQHIELQNEIQAKLKIKNQISSLNNEVESVKKSEKWYSDQLHACQLQKNKIQQELMSAQSNLVANAMKIDKLKNEMLRYQNIAEETKTKAIKEKEKMFKRMEAIEADLIERQVLVSEKTESKPPILNGVMEENLEHKLLLEEYQEKVANLCKIINEKDEFIVQLNKQGAEFLVRVTTLQKFVNEKEIGMQTLENLNKDLQMKCSNLKDDLNKKETQIFEFKNKIVNLEVMLHASNNEKNEIDTTIKTIRDDFNKFMKVYNNMKVKLEEKTKIINNFECEKQEIFMENNWRICEIEELQQKILDQKISQAEILELRNQFNDLQMEKDRILQENNDLESQLEAVDDYQKLRETLKTREAQLFNQTENCDLLNKEIVGKDQEIQNLNLTLESYELQLHSANFKLSELRDININLETKIQELYKKIRDCNYVIEQFNNLCRTSELEKHDLAVKLESITTEHLNSAPKDFSIQVDLFEIEHNLKNIKAIINENILENNNHSFNCESISPDNFFIIISDFLIHQSKIIENLKSEVMHLKNEIKNKILVLEHRFKGLSQGLNGTNEKLVFIKDFLDRRNNENCEKFVQTYDQNYNENGVDDGPKNKNNRYDKANRTILRKLKDELRSRKTAEKSLQSLQETYNLALSEINNLKIENNRLLLELDTSKSRCNEYKNISDKQNETILILEKEKGANELNINMECTNCLELKKIRDDYFELECKFNTLKEKIIWYEKEIGDKEKGITGCKKQLFNEKLQSSSLRKQVSSIQMCLDNANSLLDTKQVELNHLKLICEKLEKSKTEISDLLETEQANCQETRNKLEETSRLLDEKIAKDQILADEIKTISCHLHHKNLEVANAESRILILQEEHSKKVDSFEKSILELENNLAELQFELDGIRNDKFFLQRLCADLKTSLQGAINQNKVLQESLDSLQKTDSLPTTKIDDEYICKLLKESTLSPDKPLLNLRSCLDSLKKEMANLQSEIIAKTQNNF